MPATDRRLAPRTKLDQVAYIHIEPDNGAIVLNASGSGLGFHSMAPVDLTAPLRFSVQEQNRRVDICGELVWTDELQKIGGVRFDALSAEAHQQVLDWIRKSGPPPAERSTLGATLLKALPANGVRSAFSLKPALAWWETGRRLKVSGFARGLASGFVLSLLAFTVVLFCYAHRREFGESLVRLGERLGANRDSGVPVRATVSAPPVSTTAPAVPASVRSGASAKAVGPVEAESFSTATPAKRQIASAYANQPVVSPVAVPVAKPTQITQATLHEPELQKTKTPETRPFASKKTGLIQREPSPVLITPPTINAVITPAKEAQPPNAQANQVATFMRSAAVAPVAVGTSPLSTRSDLQMFFDVGRFKKDWMAQDLSNKVAQLGIRTSIVQRGHLWMSSYQVLAGPYNNATDEKQLKGELLSHGYDPRPYERGSRDFSFRSRVTVRGSQLPTGDFGIAWETYVADTKVRFMQGRYVVAAVEGKWVHRDSKFLNNEYVYQIQRDASRPLLEIHFAGMDRALVLQNLP